MGDIAWRRPAWLCVLMERRLSLLCRLCSFGPSDLFLPRGTEGSNLASSSGESRKPIVLVQLDGGLEERGSELNAMRAVVDPAPAGLNELAGRDHRCVTEDGDQVALASRFDAQHAEAVLVVMKGYAFDKPG